MAPGSRVGPLRLRESALVVNQRSSPRTNVISARSNTSGSDRAIPKLVDACGERLKPVSQELAFRIAVESCRCVRRIDTVGLIVCQSRSEDQNVESRLKDLCG